jgi:GNAT superfamily N-acetyltransferase
MAIRLSFREANAEDVAEIVGLRNQTAIALTKRFGRGHWSSEVTERGVRYEMRIGRTWIARRGRSMVATFRLGTRKPWAIDKSYFTEIKTPLYLTDMAVLPETQRKGVGRRCVKEIARLAREWPAGAVRLDAYDSEAGAGGFYQKCGFDRVGSVTYRGVPLIYYEMLI